MVFNATPVMRTVLRREFPSTRAEITCTRFSIVRRFIMTSFYACSTKHVKQKVNNISCLCLLDYAKMLFRMKKKMNAAQKAAQTLSKLGASKGGKARATNLSPER